MYMYVYIYIYIYTYINKQNPGRRAPQTRTSGCCGDERGRAWRSLKQTVFILCAPQSNADILFVCCYLLFCCICAAAK